MKKRDCKNLWNLNIRSGSFWWIFTGIAGTFSNLNLSKNFQIFSWNFFFLNFGFSSIYMKCTGTFSKIQSKRSTLLNIYRISKYTIWLLFVVNFIICIFHILLKRIKWTRTWTRMHLQHSHRNITDNITI